MKRFPALMLVGLLGLTACSSTAPEHVPASDNPSVEAEVPQGSEETQSAEEKTQKKKLTLPFGETYEWQNGQQITLGKPEEFTITNPYTREDYNKGKTLKFKVTHTNKSDEPYDAGLLQFSGTSSGKVIEHIYATEDKVGQPQVEVMPGDSLTYYIGFEVEDPKDLTVRVIAIDTSAMEMLEPARFSTRDV